MLFRKGRRAYGDDDGQGHTDFRKDISAVSHLLNSPNFLPVLVVWQDRRQLRSPNGLVLLED